MEQDYGAAVGKDRCCFHVISIQVYPSLHKEITGRLTYKYIA